MGWKWPRRARHAAARRPKGRRRARRQSGRGSRIEGSGPRAREMRVTRGQHGQWTRRITRNVSGGSPAWERLPKDTKRLLLGLSATASMPSAHHPQASEESQSTKDDLRRIMCRLESIHATYLKTSQLWLSVCIHGFGDRDLHKGEAPQGSLSVRRGTAARASVSGGIALRTIYAWCQFSLSRCECFFVEARGSSHMSCRCVRSSCSGCCLSH